MAVDPVQVADGYGGEVDLRFVSEVGVSDDRLFVIFDDNVADSNSRVITKDRKDKKPYGSPHFGFSFSSIVNPRDGSFSSKIPQYFSQNPQA